MGFFWWGFLVVVLVLVVFFSQFPSPGQKNICFHGNEKEHGFNNEKEQSENFT